MLCIKHNNVFNNLTLQQSPSVDSSVEAALKQPVLYKVLYK